LLKSDNEKFNNRLELSCILEALRIRGLRQLDGLDQSLANINQVLNSN